MHANPLVCVTIFSSPASMALLFPILMIPVALLTAVFFFRAERRRSDAIRNFAAENGYVYELVGNPFEGTEAAGFRIFTSGSFVQFKNILRGQLAGHEGVICDFRYGQGKQRSEQIIAAIKIGGPLPPFTLSSENFFTRVAGALGYSDINFEFSPEFSRRYRLCSPNEEAVRALFTPDLIALFEQADSSKQPCVEGRGDWIVVYHPGRRLQPELMRDFLQEASMIASAVKRSKRVSLR